jgi:hypothetical protein
MERILTLLDIQKQAREATDIRSLEFIALNASLKLIPYKQAIAWHKTEIGVALAGASGNVSVDQDGPYAQFLKGFLKRALPEKTDAAIRVFSKDTIAESDKENWKDHIGAHAALVIFKTPQDGVMAGMWLERDKEFKDAELPLLEELAHSYAQNYAYLKLRHKSALFSPLKSMKKRSKIIGVALAVLCLLPVRLSVTAPAEVVAQDPNVITIPFDGVLDEVVVKPGEAVEENQPLFTMEKTDLEGKIEAAAQDLKSAQAKLSRLRRESLSAPEKKAELNQLRSDIAVRQIELDHAKKQMQKSDVVSPAAGVAIFADANEFEGHPVRTGEKIMIVAEPSQIELLIKVPVDNMLPIHAQSPVKFFLNVSPLSGYKAEILSMGYQPSPDADGVLSYKIRAHVLGNKTPPRIGWKGTAKIKGGWTILAYSILRRPLITLRKVSGL